MTGTQWATLASKMGPVDLKIFLKTTADELPPPWDQFVRSHAGRLRPMLYTQWFEKWSAYVWVSEAWHKRADAISKAGCFSYLSISVLPKKLWGMLMTGRVLLHCHAYKTQAEAWEDLWNAMHR